MATPHTPAFTSEALCKLRRGDSGQARNAQEAPEECHLLQAVREGSSSALGELLLRHVGITTAYVAAWVPPDDVSDVVQGVLEAAVRAVPSLRTSRCDRCCGFFAVVTRRYVYDYYRYRDLALETSVSLEDADLFSETDFELVPDSCAGEALLAHLPYRQREVVRLCVIEELRPDEAAAALGTRADAVECTCRRALRGLRRKLVTEIDARRRL